MKLISGPIFTWFLAFYPESRALNDGTNKIKLGARTFFSRHLPFEKFSKDAFFKIEPSFFG